MYLEETVVNVSCSDTEAAESRRKTSGLILHMFLSLLRRQEQSRTGRHEGEVVTDC